MTNSRTFGIPEDLLAEKLRVRELARAVEKDWTFDAHAGTTRGEYMPDFSKFMGREGLVGLTISAEYGGHGRKLLDRYLLTEELLAVGAPMAAHWGGERQVAPGIGKYGSQDLRKRYLPKIADGSMYFSVGFSEPEAGSDLGNISTTARKVDGGWRIRGRKIWTSDAHRNHVLEVLCRTSTDGGRHDGFTSLLLNLDTDGVDVRPIYYLNGEDYYCEVAFDDAFVSDDQVLGEVHGAWRQMTSELTYERAGAERYMAVYPLLVQVMDAMANSDAACRDPELLAGMGRVAAELMGLRLLGVSIAWQIDQGGSPSLAASLLKDAGTLFEQDTVEWVRDAAERLEEYLEVSEIRAGFEKQLLKAPLYTLGGGSTEILRAGIGKRVVRSKEPIDLIGNTPFGSEDDDLRSAVLSFVGRFDVTEPPSADSGESDQLDPIGHFEFHGWRPQVWSAFHEAGWAWATLPEALGGGGARVVDGCTVLRAIGKYGVSLPLTASLLPAAAMLADAGVEPEHAMPVSVVVDPEWVAAAGDSSGGLELRAPSRVVPWVTVANELIVPVRHGDRASIVRIPREQLDVDERRNLAHEPIANVLLDGLHISKDRIYGVSSSGIGRYALYDALAHAALIQGLVTQVVQMTIDHAKSRKQFGRAIGEFQLVQNHLVEMISTTMRARMALEAAASSTSLEVVEHPALVHASKILANKAATVVARSAHQVHAGLGSAMEFPLHLFTRRLWTLRDQGGTDRSCGVRLGEQLASQGSSGAWEILTNLR